MLKRVVIDYERKDPVREGGKPKPLPVGVKVPKKVGDKIAGVLLAFSQTKEDVKKSADTIFKMQREAYDAALTQSIKELGCSGSGHLQGGEELTRLRERADWAAQKVADTFHKDATRMLESYNEAWVEKHGSEEAMTRAWLGKQLREGLAKRAEWKDKQIAITERSHAIDRAKLDFWKRNGIDGEARVMPMKAVCPVCQAYVARGWVPLSEAYNLFSLPAHPSCPHLLEIRPRKETIPNCEDLWRGGVSTKYAHEALIRAVEGGGGSGNFGHKGRKGKVGGSASSGGALAGGNASGPARDSAKSLNSMLSGEGSNEYVRERTAKELAEKWDVSRDELDLLMKEDGTQSTYKNDIDVKRGFVEYVLHSWEGSSGGPVAASAIARVCDDLGLKYKLRGNPDSEFLNESNSIPYIRANPTLDKATSLLGRAMYAKTQDLLKQQGVTEITLLRAGQRNADAIFSSWTTSWGGLRHENGQIIKETIPAKYIFSVPRTGFGSSGEDEVVVLPRSTGKAEIVRESSVQEFNIYHRGSGPGGGQFTSAAAGIGAVTSALSNPDAELTFAPGLPYEGTLNGIPLKSWDAPKTPEEWNAVEGQNKSLVEPPMPQSYKKQASGCVIIEPDGRVWTVEPTNHFGGHDRVFPKGKLDEGLSLQANAIKEAHEEAGLKVKITGHLGDYERADSITRYYKAERVGGNPADAQRETQGIRLSKPDQLDKHMGEQGELLSDVKSGGSGFVRMMPVQPKVWQSNTPKWWTDPIKFSTSVPLVTPTTPKPVAPKPTIKTTTTIEKPDRKKRLIVFKKKESVDGMDELIRTLEGGSGSGNFGHKGRKGKVGGSLPGGGKSGDIAYSKHAEFPQKPYFKPEGGKFIHGPSGISIERGVDGWVAKGGSLPDGEMSAKSKQALVDAIVAANNASNGAILAKKGDKTPVKTLDKTPEKKAEKTPDEEHIGIPKNEPLLHKGLLNPDLDATIAKLEEGDAKLKALREKHDQATKAYWDKYKEIEKQADDFDVDHEKAEVELKALSAANHIAYQAANDFEDKLKEIVKLEHSIEVTFKGEGTVTPKQNKMQIAAGDWLGEHMVDGVMPSKDIKIAWSKDTKRANYDFKRINTGNDSWDRTIVHETGHYIEHKNTTVRETINEFLGRRTKKEIAVPMNGTTYTSIGTPGSSPAKSKGYDSSEITRPDKFYHPYVGKVYGGSGAFRPSEVLSMGLEAMRTSPAAFLRADPEHFRLTLAIMRGYIQ